MHPDIPGSEVLPGCSCRSVAQNAADALDSRDRVVDHLLKCIGGRRPRCSRSFVDVIVFLAGEFLLVEGEDVTTKLCKSRLQDVVVENTHTSRS